MKIGIAINEVLRDFIPRLIYIYNKYVDENDITKEDVTNFNLIEFFNFKNVNELNRFLYVDAPLEIFGHAHETSDGLTSYLNDFLMDIIDDEEHEIEIVSREVNKSIPATFFFLSKTGCVINKVRFVSDYADKWNGLDVLITANPTALEKKPLGKISVKVNTAYNKEVKADYEINSILDLIKDVNLRNKIFNVQIPQYQEL